MSPALHVPRTNGHRVDAIAGRARSHRIPVPASLARSLWELACQRSRHRALPGTTLVNRTISAHGH